MIIFIILFSKYFLTIPSRHQIICQVFNGEERSSFHPHGAWIRPGGDFQRFGQTCSLCGLLALSSGSTPGNYTVSSQQGYYDDSNCNSRAFLVVSFSMPYCPTSPYSHGVLCDTLGRSFPCLFFTFIPSFLFPELPS